MQIHKVYEGFTYGQCKLYTVIGEDILEHYGWIARGRSFLERLWTVADQFPQWTIATWYLSAVLLFRHELVSMGKAYGTARSWQTVGNEAEKGNPRLLHSPITGTDLKNVIEWAESGHLEMSGFSLPALADARARVSHWTSSTADMIYLSNRYRLSDRPSAVRDASTLAFDKFGLLVREDSLQKRPCRSSDGPLPPPKRVCSGDETSASGGEDRGSNTPSSLEDPEHTAQLDERTSSPSPFHFSALGAEKSTLSRSADRHRRGEEACKFTQESNQALSTSRLQSADGLWRLGHAMEAIITSIAECIKRTLQDWLFPLRMYFGRKIMYDENRKIVQVSRNELIKGPCSVQELEAMQHASIHTSVDVPRVHRIYRRREGTFIAMDFVYGKGLDGIWPQMDDEEKRDTVKQVLTSVAELHACRPPSDSGIVVATISGRSVRDGALGRDTVGPYSTLDLFEELLRTKPVAGGITRHPNMTGFVHGDLAARNIIRRANGRLCIIDWEMAGWWPLCESTDAPLLCNDHSL